MPHSSAENINLITQGIGTLAGAKHFLRTRHNFRFRMKRIRRYSNRNW